MAIWSLFSFSKPSGIYFLFLHSLHIQAECFDPKSYINLHLSISKPTCIQRRAGVDYGEEMHRSVKNFNPRARFIWGNDWCGGQDGKHNIVRKNFKIVSSWSSLEAKFLVKGFNLEVTQETRPPENSLNKNNVAMSTTLSFVNVCLKGSTGYVLTVV